MRHRPIRTELCLPPTLPPTRVVEELLRLIFTRYRWFTPMRYGAFASWNERIDPEHVDFNALIAVYEEHQSLCVAARTDSDFICIFPARADSPPYIGNIIWETSAKGASKPKWRSAHIEQVAELMRLVHSPLAIATDREDHERKTKRLVHDGISMVETFTVRDYSEGLAGLFWRNFFGPPFVRLFGERLASLPADSRTTLGEELVLVQPYELPGEAGTEAGQARERDLIAQLGPECFYDHAHHTPPTRRPFLEHLSEPLH